MKKNFETLSRATARRESRLKELDEITEALQFCRQFMNSSRGRGKVDDAIQAVFDLKGDYL